MTFGLEGSNATIYPVRIQGPKNVKPFLDTFHKYGHVELDTARIYCNGDTEKVLGSLPIQDFKIGTKVWPSIPRAHGAENLGRIFRESLVALKASKVDILYLHSPDATTHFEETVKAIDDLYKEGLFDRFGLSNFAAWQVTLIHQLCKQNGYVLPTVYQGKAGGLLSGRYRFDDTEVSDNSFFSTKTGYGQMYRALYWNNLYKDAVLKLSKVAAENNLTLLEASLRWMTHHSGLGPTDAVIIGSSSVHHLEDNLVDLAKGPLPTAMVTALDEAWEHVKVACPCYFNE
ncbi:hypothetical protein CPB97_009512 [Podila verticillata]|nr:hypothetical protein CPB97_009512 [Podila verticillata]